MEKKTNLRNSMSSMFESSEMKRSESEIALDDFFASEDCKKLFHQKDDFLQAASQGLFSSSSTLENISHPLLPFSFKNSEFQKGLAMSAADNPFSKTRNLYAKHCSSLAPIDSQTSICVNSPISVNNSKGSSHEQSDDDELELELEAGQCEESTDPSDVKRIRRMVSNRESARRSRRRKQAHLTDLELQVELLRAENDAMFKQLAEATQQFKDSTTNNRVLRSDVEALRAKVKLAEDMVARGSLTSSLSHLLTNYLNTSHNYMNSNNSSVNHIDHNVSPIVPPHADNNSSFPVVPEQNIGLENANANAFDSNALNGAMPEMWNWESHDIAPGSK